jgi:hypothetical protein
MARKSWVDLYEEGYLFIYHGINDHDGELTVSVHLAPDLEDPADANDPEVFSVYPANDLVEDGFIEPPPPSGPLGVSGRSKDFDLSVARYMDHLGIRRPRVKKPKVNSDGIVPSDFSYLRTMETVNRWRG